MTCFFSRDLLLAITLDRRLSHASYFLITLNNEYNYLVPLAIRIHQQPTTYHVLDVEIKSKNKQASKWPLRHKKRTTATVIVTCVLLSLLGISRVTLYEADLSL